MILYGSFTVDHVRDHYMPTASEGEIIDTLHELEAYLGAKPITETGWLTEDAAQALLSGEYRNQ